MLYICFLLGYTFKLITIYKYETANIRLRDRQIRGWRRISASTAVVVVCSQGANALGCVTPGT